jgi:ligand-binding sensor domain-containing protein
MTDPIADFLTRIRNAASAKHRVVDIPASNLKKELTKILFDRSGTIWIATDGRGLNKFTPGNRYVKEYPFGEYGDLTNHRWSLAQDKQGKIWIGTDGGLLSFDTVNIF